MTRHPPPVVLGLFTGRARPLPPEGQPSAIVKAPLEGPMRIGAQGAAGDEQADRRVHGGPDKAVHQYPSENYAVFRAQYPERAGDFVPGSIGENIASAGMLESDVCIGDLYRIGRCLLQVSQPRSPCWKIDRRYAVERLSRFVQGRRIAGWYYRVLEPGTLEIGDAIEPLGRNPDPVSIRRFWDVYLEHRPDPDGLRHLAAQAGLNLAWRRRIEDRAERLAQLAGGAGPQPGS